MLSIGPTAVTRSGLQTQQEVPPAYSAYRVVTADLPGGKGRQMQDSGFYNGSCIWDSFYHGLLCRGRFGASSHLCDRNWCLCDGSRNSCYGAEDGKDGRTVNSSLQN